MSRLDELIAELCPDGVSYCPLSEVASIDIGEFVRQDKQGDDKPYPVFNGGRNNTGMYDEYNHDGDYILISARGANAGFVNSIQGKFWAGNSCYSISVNKSIIEFKFAYHYLKQSEKRFLGIQQKGSIPAVSKKQVSELCIPVPPLPVQHEIVRMLDSFMELTAELTAELAARKKQYDYYTKKLFFDLENTRTVLLGSIATIKTGTKPSVISEEKAQYEYINAGTSNSGFIDGYNCDGDVVTTPSRGQGGIGFVAYQKRKFWLGPLCYRIQSKDKVVVDNKYLYYYLSCHKEKILQCKKEGGTPAVNASDLAMIDVILPTIEKQQKIIVILDRFEALCYDISTGLPAEIAARQKQYEYYRDKLLTFKPLS